MDAFCPHCKAKYDVDLEDDGCVTECEVCHKEFTVKVEKAKAPTHAPNTNEDAKKKVKVKGFTFDTSKLGDDYKRPADIDFSSAKSAVKFIFYLSVVICTISVLLGLFGGAATAILAALGAVIYFIIMYITYSMFMVQFEIVRHLRQIRDKMK